MLLLAVFTALLP